MENKEISKQFKLLGQLMELNEENPFKIKSINNASFKIDKLPFKLKDKAPNELESIDGIGKSTAAKIIELLTVGHIAELDALKSAMPDGILEMMTIKGLGPKKVKVVWDELGIESVGELYYACNENRLIEAKGFGLKTQEEIRKAIEFKMANAGRYLFAKIEKTAETYRFAIETAIKNIDQYTEVLVSGALRRKCEIIEAITFLAVTNQPITSIESLFSNELFEISTTEKAVMLKDHAGLSIEIYVCKPEDMALRLFETTGCEEHVAKVTSLLKGKTQFINEEELYKTAGMQFIAPELRENGNEIEKALNAKLPRLIEYCDLKGVLHNHSTWSDGIHTIKEMALYCRDVLGLAYLGISDHSKSAGYAGGLSIERVLQQHEEIDALNKELVPFKIFKGIESDILSNGDLDYPDEILARFDFIVASVHSAMKMDEEKATNRLIKAIENPYTTILGHPTGRLLLSRAGYPINYQKIIDACAANNVAIEINANPLRLDLDWRWHQYALEQGVLLAVNPDAHRNEGFLDMHYGIYVGRKGGLSKEKCLNSFNLAEFSKYLEDKKAR